MCPILSPASCSLFPCRYSASQSDLLGGEQQSPGVTPQVPGLRGAGGQPPTGGQRSLICGEGGKGLLPPTSPLLPVHPTLTNPLRAPLSFGAWKQTGGRVCSSWPQLQLSGSPQRNQISCLRSLPPSFCLRLASLVSLSWQPVPMGRGDAAAGFPPAGLPRPSPRAQPAPSPSPCSYLSCPMSI